MDSSDPILSSATPSSQCLSLSPSMTVMDNLRHDSPQPQYLKLEDLQSAASPAATAFDSTTGTQQSPASVIIHSRPAKKRKSWGQELPQPKTNLPPRKRAKTDDEKEQRRIERIKRNRAAAHNSRERKRQETENLAVLLARARAELDAYRRLHGPLPADIVLPEVTLNKDPYVHAALDRIDCSDISSSESPGPKDYDDTSSCMPSPAISLLDSNVSIKQEPLDTTVSPMAMFEGLDSKPSPPPTLDVTQHSAEMLCDLPCPSSLRGVRTRPSLPSRTSNRQFSISQASHAWWARLFLYHIHLHIQTAYRQILLSIWTISPSRMQALITRAQASTTTRLAMMHSSSTTSSTRTPSPSMRPTQLLAQLNAATSRAPLARRSESKGLRRTSNVADGAARSAERGQGAVHNASQPQNGVSENGQHT